MRSAMSRLVRRRRNITLGPVVTRTAVVLVSGCIGAPAAGSELTTQARGIAGATTASAAARAVICSDAQSNRSSGDVAAALSNQRSKAADSETFARAAR